MTVREYLASAPVIATRSLEEAREAVTRGLIGHDLSGPDDRIDMRLNAAEGRQMGVLYGTYQAEVDATVPPTEDCYVVCLTVGGQLLATRDDGGRVRAAAHEGGFVYSQVQTHRIRLSPDAELLGLRIPRADLEAHLADLLGRPVAGLIEFDFGLDLRTGPGRALLEAVQFLAAELDRPAGIAGMPLARGQLEAYVLSTLLYAGRHRFTDALLNGGDGRRLGRLAPVVDYIEEHPDRELTPQILARVACVSVRTLHAAFQEQFGVSPMAYVRKVRLNRVRADLLRGDPQLVGVTEIARRWGFVHLSRFAQQVSRPLRRAALGHAPALTPTGRRGRTERIFRVAPRIVRLHARPYSDQWQGPDEPHLYRPCPQPLGRSRDA